MPTRIKDVNGSEYLYYVYYEDGKKKDVYCGLASKTESKEKALSLEMEDLGRKKKIIVEKMEKLSLKLNK